MRVISVTDADLLGRCREGQSVAFGEIVARYGALVRALAFSACGDRAQSEDIAQEVFVVAWRRLGDVRDGGKFRPWLCAIARQQSRMTLRRASRRPEGHAAALDELAETPSAEPAPDERAAQREEEALVWRALERLPLAWREVLVLHYREEYTAERIAAELGLSAVAVRQRLVRGRALLRERVADVVETSLRRGRTPHAALSAAALAALPPSTFVAAPASAGVASTATCFAASTTQFTQFMLMTKLHAAVAGVVLAALATAPFFYRQSRDLASLREKVAALSAISTVPLSPGDAAASTSAPASTEDAVPRTLQDLRALLSDRPSRRHTAVLWRHAEQLSADDLRRLLGEALHLEDPDWRDLEIAALLLERLGQTDSREAAALVAGLDPRQRAAALADLAAVSPSAAAELFLGLSETERASVPLDRFLKTLAATDLAAARSVIGHLEMHERPKACGLVAAGLSETDPAAAMAYLQSLTGEDLVGGLGDLAAVERIARHDPAEISRLLDRLPINNAAVSIFASVARAWAAADQPAALAWAEGLEFEAVRRAATEALYLTWAESDQTSAFAALGRIEDDAVRKSIFHEMTWEAIERDPRAAEEWIRRMEGEPRGYALAKLGARVAPTDLERAKSLLQEAIDANVSGLSFPSEEIAWRYAQREPVAAAQWALTLPEAGSARQHGVEGVVRAWVARDPVAASEWAATLPSGEPRNGAIFYLVEGIRHSDPESAFRWAASVEGDNAKRRHLLELATDAWTKTAPAAARAAVEELPLPDAEREALISRM
ncbi:MAG: sigma-70 family RNA polymerase sigma factor [Verrucomicrobiales bacterium]